MHLHAVQLSDFGPAPSVCSDNHNIIWNGWDTKVPYDMSKAGRPCPSVIWQAPKSDSELLKTTVAALKKYNILAVTSGDFADVDHWHSTAPDLIIPAVSFFKPGRDSNGNTLFQDITLLKQWVKEGKVAVFAEISAQYRGMSPDDPRLDPYFALAEELDIPVGLHMGEGPPGGPNVEGNSQYRVSLGNPILLEGVLTRHPKLRLYVMHYGSPFIDEMIAILYSYPQVYVDIAQNNWGFPREFFYSQLKRLTDAGFGKRILFGSDQMVWPQTIGLAIETVNSAPFLTRQQKEDIFYNNAARFLRMKNR